MSEIERIPLEDQDGRVEFVGTVTYILFQNEQNGYVVAKIKTDEGKGVTVTGNLLSCRKGGTYRFGGFYTTHPKYGEQFSFQEAAEVMPEGEDAILDMLSSGVIKGVGPKTAASIIKKFGDKALEIMEKTPERLAEVSGIGQETALKIGKAYKGRKGLSDTILELQELGIPTLAVEKCYMIFGADTAEEIRNNPYILVTEAEMAFVEVDQIAGRLGCSPEDKARIRCAVRYGLGQMVGNGHTFLPRTMFLEDVANMLGVARDRAEDEVIAMAAEGELVAEELDGSEVIYSYLYHKAETYVAKKVRLLMESEVEQVKNGTAVAVKALEAEGDLEVSPAQKDAITSCLRNAVTVITGGPGTGKTTIIKGVMSALERFGIKAAVVAPTGRATKRITQATGYEASTVHRLLEYTYSDIDDAMYFGKDADNPLQQKAIIVDEASMVDILLMEGLLRAMKAGSRLILVGDKNQLPSVGAGRVLSDIIASDCPDVVELKEIYRQAAESQIIVNAHSINRGEYPQSGGDFFIEEQSGREETLERIKGLCATALADYAAVDNVRDDLQVITPTNVGLLGANNLNQELQAVLNPPNGQAEKKYGSRIFREGDKVMQTKNDYTIKWKSKASEDGEGVFNGEVGYIKKIDPAGNVTVVFDGHRYVTYETALLEELELAYAITVHKAQGSEFPSVIMPVYSTERHWLPPRNLLYTGITRGKEQVVLVGRTDMLNAMVDNAREEARYAGLAARLRQYD